MSRAGFKSGAAVSASASDKFEDPGEEKCPHCRSNRYLRQNMRFMVNPDCYHKLCDSCVDHLFGKGPRICPTPGCGKTLRRNRFRYPTFQDLQMEREVDIRRRVSQIFNRREEEFDSLRDYNDYLQEVEDLTFDLINNIDVEKAEAKLKQYMALHENDIRENARIETESRQSEESRRVAEQQAARLRREAMLREEEEARLELERDRKAVVDRLAAGGDAEQIVREGQRAILKKARNRQALLESQRFDESWLSGAETGPAFKFKLKQQVKAEPEPPFDPFSGMREEREYYILQDSYPYEWSDRLQKMPENHQDILAGGYDVREYYARALCEAFSGLGVFVADDKAKDHEGSWEEATEAAATAAVDKVDVKMEDVFG